MQRKITIISLLIAVLLVITITIGTSYSLWTTSVQQASVNTVDVGCFRITFNDINITGGGDISLSNAYPLSNRYGKVLAPYKFSISNQCSVAASYDVILETLNSSTMDENVLDVYFNDGTVRGYNNNVINGLSDDAKNGMNLTRGYLPAGESITYSLRVWIDYSVTADTPNVQGKTWNGRIVVNSEATFTKPIFGELSMGDNSVIVGIDTRSTKTVSSITCYYGNKNSQTNLGTAIGTTGCQYPVNAEYIKYTVNYSDGTSDTSIIKDVKKEFHDFLECPNCVFIDKEGTYYYYDTRNSNVYGIEDPGLRTTLTSDDYVRDYDLIISNSFAGAILNSDNTIDRAFACTKEMGELLCFEGNWLLDDSDVRFPIVDQLVEYLCGSWEIAENNQCRYIPYSEGAYSTFTSTDGEDEYYIDGISVRFYAGLKRVFVGYDDSYESFEIQIRNNK